MTLLPLKFSPTDAAFSGFGFIRRHPGAVVAWGLVSLIYDLATVSVIIAFFPHKLAMVDTFNQLGQDQPEQMMALLPTVMLMGLIRAMTQLVILSVVVSAAYRAQLRPDQRSIGYMRLGKDELHMAGLFLLLAALALGYAFVIVFAYFTLALLGAGLPSTIKLIYDIALLVIAAGFFFYPTVRLSLAAPMTLEDNHVRLLESWKPTRGHTRRLAAAYLLATLFAFVLFLIIWVVVLIIAVVVLLATGHPITNLNALFARDTSSLGAFLAPLSLVGAVLYAGGSAVSLAVLTAPVAQAYKALAQRPHATVH